MSEMSSDGKHSPGYCSYFYVEPPADGLALYRYKVIVAVAFDYSGCDGPSDVHKNGINFREYGAKKCREAFNQHLVDKCE